MIDHKIQAELLSILFKAGVTRDDVFAYAKDWARTPKAYLLGRLRLAQKDVNAEYSQRSLDVINDKNAEHTLCAFFEVDYDVS